MRWNTDHHAGHGVLATPRSHGGAAGADARAAGAFASHRAGQQRPHHRAASPRAVADTVPAVVRTLHSAARQQSQRADQSIESVFPAQRRLGAQSYRPRLLHPLQSQSITAAAGRAPAVKAVPRMTQVVELDARQGVTLHLELRTGDRKGRMQRDTDLPNGRATLGRLAHDAAAGANLALTMLPKAMAYAVVAGVPPVYGLYASCAAPALAVAFGSNRRLFTGPVGVMTVLVLGSLHHFAQPFSPAYIEHAASLTLMVGVITLVFAAARLGFLVRAIPTAVTEGFIAAAALLIIGTQVGPALGAPPPSARSGIHLPAFLAEAAEAWAHRDVLVHALFAACIAIALVA